MKIQAVLFLLALAAGTLISAEAATIEEDAARLEASASWGVDLTSGKIAIDPSLIVYSDAASRTIVIHPKHVAEAAASLNATVREDGSFEFSDGTAVRPIVGQLSIVVGNEPDGLLADSGLPTVEIGRVRLIPPVSDAAAVAQAHAAQGTASAVWIGEQRRRSWRKCSGCIACPHGCANLTLYEGNNYRPCSFSWPWNRCTETLDFRCRKTDFSCIDCTGEILGETATVDWSCGGC